MGLLDQLFGLQNEPDGWAQRMQAQMQSGMISPSPTNYEAPKGLPGSAPPQAGLRKMFPAPDAPKPDARMNLGGPAAAVEAPTAGTYLKGALQGFGGKGGGSGILGAISGAMNAGDEVTKQNELYQTLVAGGIDPRTAQLAIKQPEALKVIQANQEKLKKERQDTELITQRLKALMQVPGMTQERAFALARDEAGFRDQMKSQSGGSTEYGTSVQWGQDGKAYVIGKDGTAKALNTDLMPPDELARARAGGTLTGKTVAQAKADLPRIETNAAKFLTNLDMIEKDPAFDRMIGPIDTWRPNVSGDARRFNSRIKQTMGESFLEAFGALKGGGQITEIEGQKATEAVTRLGETGMSEDDYRTAINELKQIVRNGVIRARVMAGTLPESELAKVIDLESLGVPSAPAAPGVTPQNRAGAGQPITGASGKSRIIGVE
jgi:hypothetical protein